MTGERSDGQSFTPVSRCRQLEGMPLVPYTAERLLDIGTSRSGHGRRGERSTTPGVRMVSLHALEPRGREGSRICGAREVVRLGAEQRPDGEGELGAKPKTRG